MVFTYINPAVAVAAGVLLLGEPFTATIAAAFVLILSGCVLATGARRSARGAVSGGAVGNGTSAMTRRPAPERLFSRRVRNQN